MNKNLVTFLMALCVAFSVAAQKDTKPAKTIQPKTVKLKLNVEQTTASGLKIKLIQEGKGKQATVGSTVSVHYVGTLLDGKKFDSSRDRGEPIKFKLGEGRVIKGWDEGIAMLKVGDKAMFTIPPSIGYGDRDMGSIPPNSTLIFEVELMEVAEGPKPFDVKGKETKTTASGLQYILVEKSKDANAPKAEAGKKVSVHYTGMLMDGKVFDSSRERGAPIEITLGVGQVIPGWDEGIALMHVGDKMRLIIPANLAYGEKGAGGVIPPNATLQFDVELVAVKEGPKPFDVKGKDTVTTASGLKYIVVEKAKDAAAVKPQVGQTVSVHYTGMLLSGKTFDSSVERGSPFEFPLGQGQVIKGWDEGVALMQVGDKVRFIIPAELGYGANGAGGVIPPNATLLFDVELLGIK
jgi:peptidylprolyl isomerase